MTGICTLKKKRKVAEANLDMKAYKHYPTLTREEIKTLIVDEKWFTTIETKIQDEIIQVSQILDRRLKELTERYEKPLPEINEIVSSLEEKVNQHLERMGFSWR
jgi:type I restriction enzyme M protein